jgi:hypothetical protein
MADMSTLAQYFLVQQKPFQTQGTNNGVEGTGEGGGVKAETEVCKRRNSKRKRDSREERSMILTCKTQMLS